jgi:hypothetical protein
MRTVLSSSDALFLQLLGGFPEKSGVRLSDLSTYFPHTQLNKNLDKRRDQSQDNNT